jgi:hypothetical protein
MTQQEKDRLERNLTESALKAKKFWVRGKIGHAPDEQGFFDVLSVPVSNRLQGKETPLGELLSDLSDLAEPLKKLAEEAK